MKVRQLTRQGKWSQKSRVHPSDWYVLWVPLNSCYNWKKLELEIVQVALLQNSSKKDKGNTEMDIGMPSLDVLS